jgi:hypothetical protein
MPRTPFGRRRTTEFPYAVYVTPCGDEWRVLKTYRHPHSERDDKYATWLVAVRNAGCYVYETRDIYVRHIRRGILVWCIEGWLVHYDAEPVQER